VQSLEQQDDQASTASNSK